MPAKNSRKIYVENGYYHIYNRGVEKRKIFTSSQDYGTFLKYLKEYLEPKNEKGLYEKLTDESLTWPEKSKILKLIRLNNFYQEIELIAYCLMPNHFHLLIKQNKVNSMDRFTNSFLTRYSGYFNRSHQRVGKLFQDVYKAVLVVTEGQLLNLTKYIHRNPLDLAENQIEYQRRYTSLPEYLGSRKTLWIKTQTVLSYFSRLNPRSSYSAFVKETDQLDLIKEFLLENLE